MNSFKLKMPAILHPSKIVYRSYRADGSEIVEIPLTLSKDKTCENEEFLELLEITNHAEQNYKPIQITLNLQPYKDELDYLEKISE